LSSPLHLLAHTGRALEFLLGPAARGCAGRRDREQRPVHQRRSGVRRSSTAPAALNIASANQVTA
jgi:hypothetical protein